MICVVIRKRFPAHFCRVQACTSWVTRLVRGETIICLCLFPCYFLLCCSACCFMWLLMQDSHWFQSSTVQECMTLFLCLNSRSVVDMSVLKHKQREMKWKTWIEREIWKERKNKEINLGKSWPRVFFLTNSKDWTSRTNIASNPRDRVTHCMPSEIAGSGWACRQCWRWVISTQLNKLFACHSEIL